MLVVFLTSGRGCVSPHSDLFGRKSLGITESAVLCPLEFGNVVSNICSISRQRPKWRRMGPGDGEGHSREEAAALGMPAL